MKKEFEEYLKSYQILDSEDLSKVLDYFTLIRIKKNTYFLKEGDISKKLGYIIDGVFRVYNTNADLENTIYFLQEKHFVVDIESFLNQTKSHNGLQALTDASVLVIGYNDFNNMLSSLPKVKDLFNRINTEVLLKKLEDRSPLINIDAKTRYLNFLSEYKTIVQKIPLNYIASYLGVTPQSLSRIRADI